MAATRYGTWDELMAESTVSARPIAARLRAIVREVHPDTCEVVRLGDHAATYGLGPRKMVEGYCYIWPHAERVNVGFFQGASLPDPAGLLEGMGARLRHVKVHSLEAADAPALRALIVSAVAERRRALGN
jgi:hypothetical protein